MPTTETLIDSLRIKLVIDANQRLDFMQWVTTAWSKIALGNFYGDESDAEDAVVDATRRVLTSEGRNMNDDVERNLRQKISLDTTGKQAVKAMIIASDNSNTPLNL